MTEALTKFVVGDVCWLISEEEYFEYALPIAQENGDGYIYRGGEQEIELYTGDASAAGMAYSKYSSWLISQQTSPITNLVFLAMVQNPLVLPLS